MSESFTSFFETATGNGPYDYQRRLAGDNSLERCRPLHPTSSALFPCESLLIAIPTGLGKTAAVVMAWLGNRVGNPSISSQPSSSNAAAACASKVAQIPALRYDYA